MRLRRRLDTLEPIAVQRWRNAWEHSATAFDRHIRDVNIDIDDLLQELQTGLPHLSNDEIEEAGREFLQTIGVTQYDAFSAWFESYELPDPDAERPDLSMWPSDVPTPPEELPGEWARALPFVASDDLVERLAAQAFLCIVASARTARESRQV